jgi:CMP-N-acetylneuraminic acid synthetase
MNLDKVLALIPARGQSKGVPRKNIRECGGKPLIAWSIEAALEAGLTPYVSTEDNEIAEISMYYGAKIIRRPKELAQDDTPTVPVVQHALANSQGCDWVLLLQPTNPLRTAEDINNALALSGHYQCGVISVVERNEYSPVFAKRISRNMLMDYGEEYLSRWEGRRQDRPPCYFRDGSIYIASAAIVTTGTLWSDLVMPLIMPEEHAFGIDTEMDFRLADMFLRERVPA